MFFLYLAVETYSAQPLPVLQECSYYDTYNYSCIDSLTETEATETLTLGKSITYFDVRGVKRLASLNSSYLELLQNNSNKCKTDKNNHVACNFVASACALAGYYKNSATCKAFNELFSSTSEKFADYQYWPASMPFIEYGTTVDNALDEDILATDISTKTLNFQLARFNKNGEFLGFMKMKDQFIQCTDNKEGRGFWRLFGTQFSSKCKINVKEFIQTGSTDLFDPFIVENVDGVDVLRPVPVKIMTYHNEKDEAVNQEDVARKQRVFRRFFMLDDYTNNIFIQYLSDLTIIFNTKENSDVSKIPIIEVSYSSVRRDDLQNVEVPLVADEETLANAQYQFRTVYNRNMDKWTDACIYTIIGVGIAALIFWLYRSFIVVRRYGEDGIDFYVLLAIVTELLSIISYYIFLIAFAFSFAIFCAYKWHDGSYKSISDDLSILTPFIWVAFAVSLVAAFLKTLMQYRSDVFIMDWEPRHQGAPVSAWRRIMIANEWIRMLFYRSYNVPFTLITMLFIIDGFDMNLIETGAPTSKLIDSGETIPILRFGFITFIYICLLLVEYIFTLIKDAIFGSRFHDFITLCRTANVSVLAMISRSWGYYIHGRSMTESDAGLGKLTEEVANEELTKKLNVKAIDGTEKSVFEVFLAPQFREPLTQAYSRVINAVYHTPRNLRESNTSSISPEQMTSYDQLNSFIQRFFAADEKTREYDVVPRPVSYTMFRVPPSPEERSIMYAEPECSLKVGVFGRSEWLVALMDLLFFCGVDYATNSATVAAFTTILCDSVIMAIFRQCARSNIARKSLLDHRFLIE